MSKAKVRRGVRSAETPNLHWYSDGGEFRVYVLDTHESFDMGGSSNHPNYVTGPGAVLVELSHGGCRVSDFYVGSQSIWGWIQRLLTDPTLPLRTAGEHAVTDRMICADEAPTVESTIGRRFVLK